MSLYGKRDHAGCGRKGKKRYLLQYQTSEV